MCLLAFELQNHPNYKLVLMANRDEEYKRPTAPADFWSDDPTILAGRDLEQLGTWLGINKQGKIAALTNYRDFTLPIKGEKSRGHIVSSFLQSDIAPQAFMEELHANQAQYTGFNVLAGSSEELFYYSNIEQSIKQVTPGIHGLSNALLDTPWPKVEKTKTLLRAYMEQTETVDPEVLFSFMQRAETFPAEQLPDTGVGSELESLLSSIFIASKEYGTRCTTVVMIDKNNDVYFEERTFKNGIFATAKKYTFTIEKTS
ncbi:NRDE family protein [Sporosarcina sp. GW1-11]|uniref:NRDE family protein n=1 Tax=Sporosarcina sp. GW1-11 TaxID=2899126 RepID=UPI00294DD608|nr:NRDE family protein [Sporosarcina sp. GW1-11]MDV6377044.1 NRDE family protein [Sporosarcina sp. GW1-11]